MRVIPFPSLPPLPKPPQMPWIGCTWCAIRIEHHDSSRLYSLWADHVTAKHIDQVHGTDGSAA